MFLHHELRFHDGAHRNPIYLQKWSSKSNGDAGADTRGSEDNCPSEKKKLKSETLWQPVTPEMDDEADNCPPLGSKGIAPFMG